jgi:hypothetical protein
MSPLLSGQLLPRSIVHLNMSQEARKELQKKDQNEQLLLQLQPPHPLLTPTGSGIYII